MDREEAIKIVQSATVWTDEERKALAMLIPELAESEEERIRMGMIDEIKAILRGEDLGFPPQEVAEKSANETAITCRIRQAIDIIQQSEQPVEGIEQIEQAEKALMKELDEKIKKVSEAGTWDGIDVDKYLNEIRGGLTWQDIRRIVKIADDLLDDPKARVAFQNHNEEYYYKRVLEQYNYSRDEANSED